MKKKLLPLLLTLCLTVTALLIAADTAHAATVVDSGECGDNLTWTLTDDGTLTISGTGAMWDYDVMEISGYGAGTTAPWGERWNSVTKLIINNGVTTIGRRAFSYCNGFTGDLVIPDSITTIGDFAFYNCGFTGNLTIGDSVITIGRGAFFWGGFTGSLTIPDSVTTIGEDAFYVCGFTGSLTIPDSVTTIGTYAFDNCTGINEIIFLGSAPGIEGYAFNYVTAIAYYPYNDATWTSDKLQNYGGELTWVEHHHSWSAYLSDNNGTPSSQGTKTAKCTKCSATNTVADVGVYLPDVEMLAPVGHTSGNIIYWNAVEGAKLYQVYRLNNGTWELLKNTGSTAYKDETAPVGVKCYYKVRARQDSLMSSMAIPAVSVTRPAPITKLDNVTITSINPHTTGNIIYWNAVPNAKLYQVYRLNGSSWQLLKNTGSTAYKDETAPVGVKSYYKIVARRDSLASDIKTTTSTSATRPAAITKLSNVAITSINPHKTGNIIYWNAVPNAKLYQVYRLNGSSWELLKNTGSTAFKDETAPCATKTYYKIVARNGDIKSDITKTTSTGATRPHDYQLTASAEVSCTSDGYTTYTCNACSHSYTNTTAALGHNWKDATCTQPKTCNRCSTTSGSALGHSDNGNNQCSRCNAKVRLTTDDFSITLKIPSVGTQNYYAQIVVVNRSGSSIKIPSHVSFNGYLCRGNSDYTVESGYRATCSYYRAIIPSDRYEPEYRDMYLDNNSSCDTVITWQGEQYYVEFGVNGITTFYKGNYRGPAE